MPVDTYKLVWPKKMLETTGGALETLNERNYQKVKERCGRLQLDDAVFQGLYRIYLQVAAWLIKSAKPVEAPGFFGINGAQGTGKSTAAFILNQILRHCFNKKVCMFSLDDLYQTRKQRAVLARNIHPLLITRGVPGTHDIRLGLEIFSSLRSANENTVTRIPVFDKATDDRCREDHWQRYTGRPDIVILEGWCVSAVPQKEDDLKQAINKLERLSDHDGVWRRYVNSQLAEYQLLFKQIDFLMMLKAPGFAQVYEWRLLQEQKLRQEVESQGYESRVLMDEEQIRWFTGHFERLTKWTLAEMPYRADLVLSINKAHKIVEIILNNDAKR